MNFRIEKKMKRFFKQKFILPVSFLPIFKDRIWMVLEQCRRLVTYISRIYWGSWGGREGFIYIRKLYILDFNYSQLSSSTFFFYFTI